MHPLTEIKNQQKERGSTIRKLKNERKGIKTEDEFTRTLWSLYKLRVEFRHIHIAYCETRGKTRGQIEIPRENNLPNEDKISEIKEEIIGRIREYETIRNNS